MSIWRLLWKILSVIQILHEDTVVDRIMASGMRIKTGSFENRFLRKHVHVKTGFFEYRFLPGPDDSYMNGYLDSMHWASSPLRVLPRLLNYYFTRLQKESEESSPSSRNRPNAQAHPSQSPNTGGAVQQMDYTSIVRRQYWEPNLGGFVKEVTKPIQDEAQ